MTSTPLITRDPTRMGGAIVFAGTRVPVATLFDYLIAGDPMDEFFTDFPSVERAHVAAVLRLAREMLHD